MRVKKKVFAIHIKVKRPTSVWDNILANARGKLYNQKKMNKST